LLTGKPPFSKSEARSEPVLSKVQRGDYRRPRELWPDVPRALEAICLKAMALAPEKRYRSAQALAEDVERWLEDEPVHALPDTYSERVVRRLRKRPLRVGVVAALVFTAVGAWAAEALHMYRDPVVADAPPEWQAERTRLEETVARLASEKEGLRDSRHVVQTKLERVQDQLATAHRSATESQQELAAASKDRDHWRQQHTQAVADAKAIESKFAPLAAELRAARTKEVRAHQQLATLMSEGQKRFDETYKGVEGAFNAFADSLDDPSRESKVKRLFAFAKLQRRLGDMYSVLDRRVDAEREYNRAIKAFALMDKAKPTKGISAMLAGEQAIARHNLAWLLVSSPTEPRSTYTDALRYVELALKVMDSPDWQLTRGMALYRLGDPRARGLLKEVQGKLRTESPSDHCVCLLFLAMIESRLGNRDAADTLLREEEQRHEQNDPPLTCELARFRREAEAVLADPRKAL
jgi:tetratricopeptide (TPR) repeat protein